MEKKEVSCGVVECDLCCDVPAEEYFKARDGTIMYLCRPCARKLEHKREGRIISSEEYREIMTTLNP